MADNYLERRMEDLRRGSLSSASSLQSVKRSGMNFPFPPKRVLIATKDKQAFDISRPFLKAGCQVAMFIRSDDTLAATKAEVRSYPVLFSSSEDISSAFSNLLQAWRDLDIVISDVEIIDSVSGIWIAHRRRFPNTSFYVPRLIVMGGKGEFQMEDLPEELSITINFIKRIDPSSDITDLIPMLVLPKNHIIDRMEFEV